MFSTVVAIQGLQHLAHVACELRVQLSVVRGALAYDPPLEELRAQYYRTHLRAFLNIPALFKVLGGILFVQYTYSHRRG